MGRVQGGRSQATSPGVRRTWVKQCDCTYAGVQQGGVYVTTEQPDPDRVLVTMKYTTGPVCPYCGRPWEAEQ